MTRTFMLLLLCACTDPAQRFAMPRNIEDARARLLAAIPEGREIAGARQWMGERGFTCDAPLPSATDAHAHLCKPATADAGWSRWTVVLFERRGRLADVQVR
jgi:hypothetical protein